MNHAQEVLDQTDGWQRLERRYEELTRPRRFEPWSICPDTARDLDQVAEVHDLTSEELLAKLDGNRILDIGAGASLLEEEARRKGIKSEVVPLNLPRTYFERTDHGIKMRRDRIIGYPNRAVVATGHELPFRSESFDLILATFSLPFYATSSEVVINFLDEATRVLKNDGEMLVGPCMTAGGGDEPSRSVQATFLGKLIDLRDRDNLSVTLNDNDYLDSVSIRKG